jgi:uncharacterized protein (DUF58 family)
VDNPIYEDITRYRSLRDYLPGDTLRRVNWKASAKTGKLFVTDYLPLLHAPVLILLNLRTQDYPLRYRYHRIERAATLAASLVIHFLALRQEIGLIACASLEEGETVPAVDIRGTHEHATTLLELLARIEPAEGGGDFSEYLFSSGLEVPVRTRVEVITPGLVELDLARLRRIKEKGCTVEIFLFGDQVQTYREKYGREFAILPVQDFGNELVYQ